MISRPSTWARWAKDVTGATICDPVAPQAAVASSTVGQVARGQAHCYEAAVRAPTHTKIEPCLGDLHFMKRACSVLADDGIFDR